MQTALCVAVAGFASDTTSHEVLSHFSSFGALSVHSGDSKDSDPFFILRFSLDTEIVTVLSHAVHCIDETVVSTWLHFDTNNTAELRKPLNRIIRVYTSSETTVARIKKLFEAYAATSKIVLHNRTAYVTLKTPNADKLVAIIRKEADLDAGGIASMEVSSSGEEFILTEVVKARLKIKSFVVAVEIKPKMKKIKKCTKRVRADVRSDQEDAPVKKAESKDRKRKTKRLKTLVNGADTALSDLLNKLSFN